MKVGEKKKYRNRDEFREWLEKNHDKKKELWIIFYKKHLNKGMPYDDAVEEALCFGWIDGILKRIDEEKYIIRFSPRRPKSVWSKHNIARAKKMIKEGKMKKIGKDFIPKKGDPRIYLRLDNYYHGLLYHTTFGDILRARPKKRSEPWIHASCHAFGRVSVWSG